MVIAVGLELLMGIIAIATGSTVVGLVACASMAGCTWLYAVAEIVAFYRVGLPQPDRVEVGQSRGQGHRPYQAF